MRTHDFFRRSCLRKDEQQAIGESSWLGKIKGEIVASSNKLAIDLSMAIWYNEPHLSIVFCCFMHLPRPAMTAPIQSQIVPAHLVRP
jgi:hypothetical protein